MLFSATRFRQISFMKYLTYLLTTVLGYHDLFRDTSMSSIGWHVFTLLIMWCSEKYLQHIYSVNILIKFVNTMPTDNGHSYVWQDRL